MKSNFSSQIAVQSIEGVPCIILKVPGSTTTWQDWLVDSITLMASTEGSSPWGIKIVSFHTGRTLLSLSMPPESFSQLATQPVFGVLSSEMGPDLMIDTAMAKFEPFDNTGNFSCAISHFSKGHYQEAIKFFDELLTEIPNFPRASNLKGLCWRMLQDFEKAEQAYLREIEIDPESPDAYCNLGVLYRKTKRDAMARIMFEKSLERYQFYFNALLQFSKLLVETEGVNSRLLGSINHRLLAIYPDISSAREQLLSVSRQVNLTLPDYSNRIRTESGIFSNNSILNLMKRAEALRFNGAFLAAAHGYIHLLSRAGSQKPLLKFLLHWISKRLRTTEKIIPVFMKQSWERIIKEITTQWAEILQQDLSEPPPIETTRNVLNPHTFFVLVIEEILFDGQITKAENELIGRLKNILRIDDATFQLLFAEAKNQVESSPTTDSGREFNARRLCKKLISTVLMDGKIEPSERALLNIAGETLNISPPEIDSMLSEQCS